jgi:hypothetical protein
MIATIKIENNCLYFYANNHNLVNDNCDVVPIKSIIYITAITDKVADNTMDVYQQFRIGLINAPSEVMVRTVEYRHVDDVETEIQQLKSAYQQIRKAVSDCNGGFMLGKPKNFKQ